MAYGGSADELSTALDNLDHRDPQVRKIIEKNGKKGPFGLLTQIVWSNVVIFIILHLLALGGVLAGPQAKWESWIMYLFYYLCSGLGVTAGAHRLWSHRSYKAKLPISIMLMCFNCISMQNNLLEWCRDHRVHHKYTETNADPHNAKRGFFFAHMGWLLMKKHPDVIIKGRMLDLSDLEQDPVVMFQRRHYLKLCFFFTLFIPVFVPWYFWGEDLLVAFLVLMVFRYVMTLHSTWLVNSAAHLWGSRRYNKNMSPSDNRFVSFAAIGEGFHNYHHTFPHDYATSEWGPNINITTICIDFWAALGLVYDRKQVSQQSIERIRHRIGDLSHHH